MPRTMKAAGTAAVIDAVSGIHLRVQHAAMLWTGSDTSWALMLSTDYGGAAHSRRAVTSCFNRGSDEGACAAVLLGGWVTGRTSRTRTRSCPSHE